MKRVPSLLGGLVAVLLMSACGAGTAKNEETSEHAVALWPLTTTSEEARQLVVDGLREQDMNRFEEASTLLERAVVADPTSAMVYLYASGASPNLETSFAHFKKAIELAPRASETERVIIDTYRLGQEGDNEAALASAQQVTKLEPANPRSWIMLGQMHSAIAQFPEGRAAWAKGIEVAPTFAGTYMIASASYATIEPRDLPKAEQLARKAVELEPNESYVYDILGDALRAQGKLEEAAQAYTKAAELDPTDGGPLQQRGHVNTFLGRYSEARADYDAATARAIGQSKVNLPMYRALVHIFESDRAAAIAELEELYNSVDGLNVPEPSGAKYFVSAPQFNIAVWSGMFAEAERFADRLDQLDIEGIARAKDPGFERGARAGMTFRRVRIALHKGDFATARQKLDEYVKIRASEKNPIKNRPVHDVLGFIALKEKRFDDAVKEMEQGSPNNLAMVYFHGLALEGAGRKAEADKQFAKIESTFFLNEMIAMLKQDVAQHRKATI